MHNIRSNDIYYAFEDCQGESINVLEKGGRRKMKF